MKYIKYILPILVIFLTIGYAATNVTLSISGDAFIASDLEDFEVYISNSSLDGEVDLSLLSGEMEFTFTADYESVHTNPYAIRIELTNNSSKFDARIDVACNISDPLTIVSSTAIPSSVKAKKSDNAIINFDASYLEPGTSSTISCKFTATPIERTSLGEGEVPADIYRFEVGEVVSIGNEKFNVISDNGNTVTMLAQYNLDTSYRQNTLENAVTFSNTNGWEYTPGPKEIDIQSYHGNAQAYVNGYVSYLNKLTGTTSVSGDLITMNQLSELGCVIATDYTWGTGGWTCSRSEYSNWLINNQNWWTRSAYSTNSAFLWIIFADGSMNYDSFGVSYGIRPIITVSKNTLFKDFISFTLDGTSYLALDGMNINEWLNSIYNYDSYYLSYGVLYNSDGSRRATISGNTEIIEGLSVNFSAVINGSHGAGWNE